jgi:predicted nucleotidyltransferase
LAIEKVYRNHQVAAIATTHPAYLAFLGVWDGQYVGRQTPPRATEPRLAFLRKSRIFLRKMRKSSPLDPLISKTMQRLLASTVLCPDRSWYMSGLAQHLAVPPSSLQSSLAALVKAGILIRRKEGNRVYFQADPNCPFLPELQGLIRKTVGLVEVLRDSLARLKKRINVAFVHGSVARSAEQSSSDVDLIVVGTLGLGDLAPALATAEARLDRQVNASVYTPEEFAKKLSARNHFLSSVLQREKVFVFGGKHDLETIAGISPHRSA